MEYRSIVLDENQRESETKAERWKNTYMYDWVVGWVIEKHTHVNLFLFLANTEDMLVFFRIDQ